MTSSFFNFANLDQLQYDCFEPNMNFEAPKTAPVFSKDPSIICTEAPSEESFTLSSRSKKTCLNPFQSSFQCNFAYEHVEALNKKIQNFMEAISSCSHKIQIQELKAKILHKEMSFTASCEEILDSDYCEIDQSEKDKFRVDLRFEKKFKEFLDEVCKKFSPDVAGEMIAIADYIWLHYTKVMDERFSESELKNWAENVAETKFDQYKKFVKRTKEICFRENEQEIFPNFYQAIKDFMSYFFVTIVLVIEQYFENPFFQEDRDDNKSFKRAFSDEDCYSFDQFSELQRDIYGGKKLKF